MSLVKDFVSSQCLVPVEALCFQTSERVVSQLPGLAQPSREEESLKPPWNNEGTHRPPLEPAPPLCVESSYLVLPLSKELGIPEKTTGGIVSKDSSEQVGLGQLNFTELPALNVCHYSGPQRETLREM